ncbi:MAG: hypothetical protein GSR73_05900 [Desulfurococcales archaeon]|nr:hypothetical protein [Desulfurococcales archaeon]
MARIVWVKGEYRLFDDLGEALKLARENGGVVILFEDEPIVLRVEKPQVAREKEAGPGSGASSSPAGVVAIVLDQMFRGLAEVVARELSGPVEVHEVLGKGLESPVKAGRVTRWPAHDDYDVLKIVERLAGSGRRVILVTGDKRLARQVESLGDERIRVEYMPPNEFPGKESIIRRIVSLAR